MKKRFFSVFFLLPVFLHAQEIPESLYVAEIRSKIGSPSAEQIDLENGSERFTAFYFNDELISLRTTENGELANSLTTDYFIRNDSLIAFHVRKCLTSQEILDIDMYAAGHTNAKTGATDWSGLPADCMEMTVFCRDKRFVKTVSGNDVFDQPGELSELCEKENLLVKSMLLTLHENASR